MQIIINASEKKDLEKKCREMDSEGKCSERSCSGCMISFILNTATVAEDKDLDLAERFIDTDFEEREPKGE